MEKLFSVERDSDGNIKVIAGNMTKTYNDLPISTVSFLFGLSEYVARSAGLFEKYVKPEREAEFSDRMNIPLRIVGALRDRRGGRRSVFKG